VLTPNRPHCPHPLCPIFSIILYYPLLSSIILNYPLLFPLLFPLLWVTEYTPLPQLSAFPPYPRPELCPFQFSATQPAPTQPLWSIKYGSSASPNIPFILLLALNHQRKKKKKKTKKKKKILSWTSQPPSLVAASLHPRSLFAKTLLGSPRWLLSLALRCVASSTSFNLFILPSHLFYIFLPQPPEYYFLYSTQAFGNPLNGLDCSTCRSLLTLPYLLATGETCPAEWSS
jgi:hypothetical protein